MRLKPARALTLPWTLSLESQYGVAMRLKPARALTRSRAEYQPQGLCIRSNEVEAREGIDTL